VRHGSGPAEDYLAAPAQDLACLVVRCTRGTYRSRADDGCPPVQAGGRHGEGLGGADGDVEDVVVPLSKSSTACVRSSSAQT